MFVVVVVVVFFCGFIWRGGDGRGGRLREFW